ncbi:MAG TPA: hypothetical protein VLF43_02925, partial [Candidatus Saccharimonadales bacterium]|nr:hypothetical protein [Candidatus Saccharimonadales bacterium]
DRLGGALDVLDPTQRQGLMGQAGTPRSSYWTIVSGNTTPKGIEDVRAMAHFGAVVERLEDAPQFPLGAYLHIYQPGTPICTVRADLNDVSIELYRRQCAQAGTAPEDIMLLNVDADTRDVLVYDGLPYIDQIVRARQQSPAPYLEVYPRLMHAQIDEERAPRMHRLITWRDYVNAKFEFSFAAHYGVNLYGYLDSGGFDRNWDNNEQLQLGDRLAARAEEVGAHMQRVALRGVAAVVSPRRYIIELATGRHMGYGALCVPPDGQPVHVSPDRIEDLSVDAFKGELAYEVQRIGERGLEKFVAEYTHDNPGATRDAALDYAYDKVCGLVQEERIDSPNTDGMNRIVARALADLADHIEDLKGQAN